MNDGADEAYMRAAIAEAALGLARGEVPIGSVVVREGSVVAAAHWVHRHEDLLAHPEFVALRASGARAKGAVLYTTLEPCPMCMGAAMSSFIARVVFALSSPTDGAGDLPERYRERLPLSGRPWSIPEVRGGVGLAASRTLIKRYLDRAGAGSVVEWARSLAR